MTRPIAFVYVLGLFLLGIVVGALGMHLYHAHTYHAVPGPPAGPDEMMRPGPHFWRLLKERLEISTEQEEEIRQIIDEARVDGAALHQDVMPKVHELMERTQSRLMDVLTPEQREEFEKMHRHQRRGAEWFFLGHGAPGGHRRGPGRRWGKGPGKPAPDDEGP